MAEDLNRRELFSIFGTSKAVGREVTGSFRGEVDGPGSRWEPSRIGADSLTLSFEAGLSQQLVA